MADRYPLIANSSANQIQELASGDNMDLTGNNIVGVVDLTASGNAQVGGALTVTGNFNLQGSAAQFNIEATTINMGENFLKLANGNEVSRNDNTLYRNCIGRHMVRQHIIKFYFPRVTSNW